MEAEPSFPFIALFRSASQDQDCDDKDDDHDDGGDEDDDHDDGGVDEV